MLYFIGSVVFSQASDDVPEQFYYEQSTIQAFYFFYDAFDINGIHLTENDWVAAFNGDVCVGSRKWDLANCQGGVCDIPVMGNDGNTWSSNYLLPGDIPTFKIYIFSEHKYYDAIPSQNFPWENFGLLMIDNIQANI